MKNTTKNKSEAPITSADLLKKLAELAQAQEALTSQLSSIEAAEKAAAEERAKQEREDIIAKILKLTGTETVPAFLKWLNPPKRRGRKAGTPVATGRKSRTSVTEEMKIKGIELLKAGKSAPEVAAALGISRSAVNKLKSSGGLTKKRGVVVQAPPVTPPAQTVEKTAAVA